MTESLDSSAVNARGSFAVEIRGLHKSYGDKRVLAGIDLVIERGQFLVLLGPSGSGNTTILRCVTGIERISSGRLAIEGQTVADGRTHIPPERRPLAMVFQDYALRGYEHALALSDGTQLRGVFAEERSERGENVGVHLDPRGPNCSRNSDR